jgi:hypothetical protein
MQNGAPCPSKVPRTLAGSQSAIHAHHLLQRVHHVDEVALCFHHCVDVLVGRGVSSMTAAKLLSRGRQQGWRGRCRGCQPISSRACAVSSSRWSSARSVMKSLMNGSAPWSIASGTASSALSCSQAPLLAISLRNRTRRPVRLTVQQARELSLQLVVARRPARFTDEQRRIVRQVAAALDRAHDRIDHAVDVHEGLTVARVARKDLARQRALVDALDLLRQRRRVAVVAVHAGDSQHDDRDLPVARAHVVARA